MRVVYSLSQAEWCDTMCTLIIWYPNFIAYNMHYDCLIFNLGWWSTPLLYLSHLWDCLYVLSWWPNIIMWSHYYGDSQPKIEIATTINQKSSHNIPAHFQTAGTNWKTEVVELTDNIQQVGRSPWLDRLGTLSQKLKSN